MPEEELQELIKDKSPIGRLRLNRRIDFVAGQVYRRNKELSNMNNVLALLGTIDALALESNTSVKRVSEHITGAVTQIAEYPFVALFTRSLKDPEKLGLSGWSGREWLGKEVQLAASRPLFLDAGHAWFSSIESTKLIDLGNVPTEVMAGFIGCSAHDIKRLKEQLELKSVYAVKLMARRRLAGVLVIGYKHAVTEMNENEEQFIDRMSDTIGVAIDNKLLFEENRHVVKQLKAANAKLMALDEAKDDFVSMASHQLRTPLTSVKGYLSMVLEGDAGKITPQQKKLLQQSFFSSQRMVYLIADLLNMSRLKTGKFLIETAPVNLAEVVGQELEQLTETARGHSLKLVYEKPKNFPSLMLDETKTRQVIMNFADNAIHYTPAGGTITVKLTETDEAVELRVADTGMGVPRHQRKHLFTKFYRADNARKARPDGTGLGLFMAKKVIVSEGGAIIFESKEGEGSTFGFIFSKKKLAVPPKTDTNSPK